MISVIDMPPPDESIWWRGKRGFEVGFFPCECVEVIGDKVPQGLNLPMGATTRLRKNSMGSEVIFWMIFLKSKILIYHFKFRVNVSISSEILS